MQQRYFSTFQLILLALFSTLVVVAKIALRAPLQLLEDVADGYRAMDERRAIKALLLPRSENL